MKEIYQKKPYQHNIKKYYQKNKDSIKEYVKEYSSKNAIKINNKKKEYIAQNIDKIRKYKKEYTYKNKNKIAENYKEYYEKNKEKLHLYQKEYNLKNKIKIKVRTRKYLTLNKRKILDASYKRQKLAFKNNPILKLKKNISTAIWLSIKKNKNGSWLHLVDYTVEILRLHLESKFTKNMSWDNYGKDGWHVDHIIPQSLFIFDSYHHDEFKKCWALSNLQPLWATTAIAIGYGESHEYIGNIEKKNKLIIKD